MEFSGCIIGDGWDESSRELWVLKMFSFGRHRDSCSSRAGRD